MTNELKFGAYLRVSKAERLKGGYSLNDQTLKTTTHCQVRNRTLVKTYTEDGCSGKNLDRPKIRELINDLQSGVINAVIVIKVDRLTRSLLDKQLLLKWFKIKGIHLTSIHENFDGLEDESGQLFLNTLTGFAEYEREKMIRLTKDSLQYRVEQKHGVCNRPPYGYRLELKQDPMRNRMVSNGTYLINNEEAEVVKRVFKDYLTGDNPYKIARSYALHMTVVKRILTNPAYTGHYVWKGKDMGKWHQAIITKEQFEQAQLEWSNRGKKGGWRKPKNLKDSLRVWLLQQIETKEGQVA